MRVVTAFYLLALLTFISACDHQSPDLNTATEAPPEPVDPPDTNTPPAIKGDWYGGDFHVHNDHSSDGSAFRQGLDGRGQGNVSVADQIGQGELAALDWMPLTDHRTYDQHWDPLWTSDSMLLIPGEEANGRPHTTIHGASDMILQGAGSDKYTQTRVYQQSIWETNGQFANAVVAHPDAGLFDGRDVTNFSSAQGWSLSEIWNRADNPEAEIDVLEDRWNKGFRFGVVGASDNHFRELWGVSGPGSPTTYIFAEALTSTAMMKAMQTGRATISTGRTGAFMTFTIDTDGDGTPDAMSGDEIMVSSGTEVTLITEVTNGTGLTVSLFQAPGNENPALATYQPNPVTTRFEHKATITDDHTWFRVEARGATGLAGLSSEASSDNQLSAIASPIFVSTLPFATPDPEIDVPDPLSGKDTAAVAIGDVGNFSGFADIAVTNGNTHMVAESKTATDSVILYKRNAEAPITLSGPSTAARYPRIAAHGDDIWVTWQDERAGEIPHRPVIYLRYSTDGGQTWDEEESITDGQARAERPVIAIDPANPEQPWVAWMGNQDGIVFDIYVQQVGVDNAPTNLSRAGKSPSNANPTDTRSASLETSLLPAIAVNANGTVAVAWTDNRFDIDPLWTGQVFVGDGTEADDWEIMLAINDGSGWGTMQNISNDATRFDHHLDIVWENNSTLHAVWDSRELRPAGANTYIHHSVTTDAGASWSAIAAVDKEDDAMYLRPRFERNISGNLDLVWYDNRDFSATETDWRYKTRSASWDGSTWTASGVLLGDANNVWPAIAGDTIVATSDRNAQRRQRDHTWQVVAQ